MRFGEPLAFLWLLLVPLWALLFMWLERRRARRVANAGDPQLLSMLVLAGEDGGRSMRIVQASMLAVAIACSAVALARPQLGMRTETRRGRGIDLVVALDLSKSMLARDVVPSRLERARAEIVDLVDRLKGDRVGLIGFTSIALPLCPLTVDHGAFNLQLRSAVPEDLPRGGTGIAEAIAQGQKMLTVSKSTGAERALLVITDGEDNLGDPIAAAKGAKEAGIAVHVVGVGSRTGEPIPILGEGGKLEGYMKDRTGQTVVSRLNEKLLRDVADAGGGLVTLPSESGGLDLVPIRAHLSTLKKAELEERTVRVYEERYQFALVPALLFLVLATMLRPVRRAARIVVRGIASAALLVLCSAAQPAHAASPGVFEREDPDARAGNAAVAAGKHTEAVEAYTKAMSRLGEDPRLLLDRGIASSAGGELDKATSDLRVAMESGKEPSTRAAAAYALGNAYRKLKKYDDAIKAYQRSLIEDPSVSGARRNLEITKRLKAIEAMQPRDPNQKNNEDGEKPPPPSNQDAGVQDGGPPGDAGSSGDSGADQSGADGGTSGDSGSAEEQNAGEQDAGAGNQEQPQEEETQPEEDEEKKSAEEMLDAVKDQEKALKRKRLLEKYRGKQVEKDW